MSVKLWVGPMYSSKTRSMLAEGEKHERAGRTVLYLKSALDTRYGRNTLTASHDGMRRESTPVHGSLVREALPESTWQACLQADVICVDEGQFLEGLSAFCDTMARVHHKRLLVAALDGDFQRKPFAEVSRLMPLCDEFQKLTSVCVECGRTAPFTRKIAGSTQEQVDVGGAEKYVPACRTHHADKPITAASIERMKRLNEKLL